MRSGIGGVTGDGGDLHRPVWVKLPTLFLRQPDAPWPATLPHPRALDTTGEIPGDLLQWLRTSGGEWLGLVTYQLPFADGRHDRIWLERQLVPATCCGPASTEPTDDDPEEGVVGLVHAVPRLCALSAPARPSRWAIGRSPDRRCWSRHGR